jgi:anti-sigma regulatory factor (Ser/Thr protein kinase)
VLLPAAPASVAIARRRLTEELLAFGVFDTAVADAALVISELLSNAIRHARPLHGSWLRVAWTVDGGSIEVAVSDGGSPTRPRPAHAPRSSLGGRGISIIEHLSRAWGVRADEGMLTVWAVLPAPPAGQAGEPASPAGHAGAAYPGTACPDAACPDAAYPGAAYPGAAYPDAAFPSAAYPQ